MSEKITPPTPEAFVRPEIQTLAEKSQEEEKLYIGLGEISSYEINPTIAPDTTEYKIAQLEQMARLFVELENEIYGNPDQSSDELWAKFEPRAKTAKLSEKQREIFAEGFRQYEKKHKALEEFLNKEKAEYCQEKGLSSQELVALEHTEDEFNGWLGKRLFTYLMDREPKGNVGFIYYPLGLHLLVFEKVDFPWKDPGRFFPERVLPGTNLKGCLSIELIQKEQSPDVPSEIELEEIRHATDHFLDRVNRVAGFERITGVDQVGRRFMARTAKMEFPDNVFERTQIRKVTPEIPGIYRDARDEILSHFLRVQFVESELGGYIDPRQLARTLKDEYDFVYHRGPQHVRNFALLGNPYAEELEKISDKDLESACMTFDKTRMYYAGDSTLTAAVFRGFDIRLWPAIERLVSRKIKKHGSPEFLEIWYPDEDENQKMKLKDN